MVIIVMVEELSSTGLPDECFSCGDREDWNLLVVGMEEMIQGLFGLTICQSMAGKSSSPTMFLIMAVQRPTVSLHIGFADGKPRLLWRLVAYPLYLYWSYRLGSCRLNISHCPSV